MFKTLSNISKVRFSFVSARVFILSMFLLFSVFAEAQTYTATNKKNTANINSTQDCGGGVYKIKFKQTNQWDNAEIYIKKDGTSIGQISGWSYADNVMRPSQWQHQMRVTSNHANRWVYAKINNGSKRLDFFFSDFSCTSCSNGTASAGSSLSGICSGGTSGAMGGSYGGGATAATWSGGAGSWTNASNSNTATYTAGASETGTITLTLTATGGCATVTDTKTITVTAAPSAGSLSGTQGVCVSGSTTFSSTVSGGTWSSNTTGVATVNSSSGAISGVSAGTATITYTKAGSGGCSNATATRTVTVTAAPSAGTLSGTQGILLSGSTTFSSTVNGGTWSSSATGVATVNSSSGAISVVSAGPATITYTKAGSGGCSNATTTRAVHVYATAPGGFTDHLHLWLKADAGTNTTTDGGEIDAWADQTYNDFDADDNNSNGPDYKTNAINGHPALDFDGSEDLRIQSGITGGSARDAYFFYIVSKRASNGSGDQHIFRQNLDNSKFLIFRHNGTGSEGARFFYGGNDDAEGRHQATWNNSPILPHLWSFGSAKTSGTPNSTHQYIQLDNTTIDNDNNTSNVTGYSTNDFHIGSEEGSSDRYTGLIAEIICLNDIPTGPEDLKIKSYLAVKYGISLGATTDLKNSAGTVVWNKATNTGYNNNITGIGRDDVSGLDQKSSQAENSSDVLKISTISNAQTGADNSFEMWANNNGSVAVQQTEKPASFSHRLTREWLVQETGTVGGVTIEFDLTGLTFANTDATKFGLVIDDDGDFSGGTQTTEKATSFTSNKLTFNSVDLTNGKYITVMNGATVLPVDLRYFEGKRIGSNVLLEWETMAEINNDYFIVEKSTDGENWEELLTVAGQGNTSESTYYSQIDVEGCSGTCYYRLTQVDFDGNSEEFKVVAVSMDNANSRLEISVSPNPINQIANIAFTAPESGIFSLTVTTQTGQVMYTANTIGDKGNNHISYNAAMLSSGSYYFILEDENGNRTQQLVIK
jgi:hypothetical protein